MKPLEVITVKRWNAELTNSIHINLILTEDERSNDFHKFCAELSETAPKLTILEKTNHEVDLPSIQIGENLHYYALPTGAEFEVFLDAIALYGNGSIRVSETIQKDLPKIDIPASLKLHIALQCPACPISVRQLIPLAILNDFIQLEIIDVFFFPELAKADNIQSVPSLLLEDEFRWIGSTPLPEIVVDILANRDPFKLNTSTIEELLRYGNAIKVSEMMLQRGEVLPSLPDFLADEKFSTRLGAMVAMEAISLQNRELANQVVSPLLERFEHANDQVKEDIIHILGETGTRETLPLLESVLNGQYNDDLKEAADEAIRKIKG